MRMGMLRHTRNNKSTNIKVILFLIGDLGDGGKERQLLLLLKELQKKKLYQTLLVVGKSGGLRLADAERLSDKQILLTKKKERVPLFSTIIRLIKITKNSQTQIIHTWGSGIWDMLGVFVACWLDIPVIVNGVRSAPKRLRLSDQLTRFSSLFSSLSIANSKAGLEAFKLTKHPRAQVIYNGLDLSRFEGIYPKIEDHKICMVANFRSEKDHNSLILSMPDIIKTFPDVMLYLIGHDGGTLSQIEDLVKKMGVFNNVVIFTDCLKPELIIAKCQVCVLSTHGEGVSNVLLEYMALSKPVIVSNNGGNPEVVVDGVTGFLVKPESPEEISKKVIELLENPDRAVLMGEAGKKIAINKFSVDAMISSYIIVYDDLTSV